MKDHATPADVAARKTMPTSTVDIQTITPVGTRAVGRRQARDNSQPSTVPLRKGQAVTAKPLRSTPSSWLRRPKAQKIRTATRSIPSQAGFCCGRMRRDYWAGAPPTGVAGW